jgi:hypothetical protein
VHGSDRPDHRPVHPCPTAGQSERSALDDRAAEEPLGARADHQVRGRVPAGRLPEDGDQVGVAAERRDVRTHPAQRLDQVEEPEVGRDRLAVAEEPEHAEPERHRHHDHALLGHQVAGVVDRQVATADDVRAAVDPDHHGQLLVRPHVGGQRDREPLAVLVDLDALDRVEQQVDELLVRLRCDRRRGRRVQLTLERRHRLRRGEPFGLRVRDPEHPHHVAVDRPDDAAGGGVERGWGGDEHVDHAIGAG